MVHIKLCPRWLQIEFHDGKSFLEHYDYEVRYLVGRDNATADMLSRLPDTDAGRSVLEQTVCEPRGWAYFMMITQVCQQ